MILISRDIPTSINVHSSGVWPYSWKCVPLDSYCRRWKQRDIHEKRELRKQTIAKLRAQIACNNVLLPRITSISANLANPAPSIPPTVYFNSLAEQLEKNPSRDCPPTNDSTKLEQTYDGMLLSLLKQVGEDSKAKVKEAGVAEADREEKLAKAIADGMAEHVKRLKETIDKDVEKLAQEENEQKKHITSEDLHEGFESKVGPSFSALCTMYLSSLLVYSSSSRTHFRTNHQDRQRQAEGHKDGL